MTVKITVKYPNMDFLSNVTNKIYDIAEISGLSVAGYCLPHIAEFEIAGDFDKNSLDDAISMIASLYLNLEYKVEWL